MKFWDASAIVPLLISEPQTRRLQAIASKESAMIVWWGTEVDCVSALARRERDDALSSRALAAALNRLRQLANGWHEVDPSDAVREAAMRFLRVHPLRTANALQLAAAFMAADRRPTTLEIVTLDDRLAAAAHKEGFAVPTWQRPCSDQGQGW